MNAIPAKKRMSVLSLGFALCGLLLSVIVLWACGGLDDYDDDGSGKRYECCNKGRYYSCPDKSASLVCDDSSDPEILCRFEPSKNDRCK